MRSHARSRGRAVDGGVESRIAGPRVVTSMRAVVSRALARVDARPSARPKVEGEARAVDRARARRVGRARGWSARAGRGDSVAADMRSTVGARRAVRRELARALGNGSVGVGRASSRAGRAMAASTSTSGGVEDEVRFSPKTKTKATRR